MDIVYNIMNGFHTGEDLINQTYFQRIMYLFTLIIGTSILGVIIKLLKTQIRRKENNEDLNVEIYIDSDKTVVDTKDEKENI